MKQQRRTSFGFIVATAVAGLLFGSLGAHAQHAQQAQQVNADATRQVTVEALEKISRQLHQPAQMRGEFRQQKTLPNLPRPLQSEGKISLSQQHGISWRTLQPVASHIVMGGEGKGGSSSAFSRQMAEPMMHILHGDFAALEQMFYVDAGYEKDPATAEAGDSWKMSLRPRNARLQKYLNAIEIFGNDSVQRIRLLEGNQSVTDIEFLNLQPVTAQDAQFLAEFDSD
ncbi:outer membrane lipoprotein carrier protein LolA [uncultured Microbulbifer sp.]|uniref:outer membrane lipoprotein carrier protein LolA n=1 Tax=uncultured Microbulbifer sp. TaxID=348147 RepID=UPI002611732E|nr:outer membrane lipoprotein carrier protein LolA [uncultured Microbulbifer sp.]